MAALQATLNIPSIALAAATAKTVGQITAPTNQRVKVLEFSVYFDGTSNTAQPVQFRILRQSTAGTSLVSTPLNPVDADLPETIQTSGLVGAAGAQTEPTPGAVLLTGTIHPQTGWIYPLPFGQEFIVQGGGRIGIELTAAATVNARGAIRCEE